MHVVTIGGGRVGVPTALALARLGHTVVVYDIDPVVVGTLAGGTVPFYEPGLHELLSEQVRLGRLRFTVDPRAAFPGAGIAFLCVDTPAGPDGRADLTAVTSAAETIMRHAGSDAVVAVKSTVPVGTGAWLQRLFDERNGSGPLHVASNPEFLQEGQALREVMNPARILVGSGSERARSVLREAYAPLLAAGSMWVETDLATAELTKYASNAFLAMKVSYANMLAEVCDALGADVVTVTRALGPDPRIGPGHLRAGMGYGGGCLTKDLAALRSALAERGVRVPLLDEIEEINLRATVGVLAKVQASLGDLAGRRVTLLGLAFKPETDDVRMAPALALGADLLAAGAIVTGYDPQATEGAERSLPDLDVHTDMYRALEGAECAVVCTEWNEIRALDLARAFDVMARPLVIDGRNVFDPARMVAAGFTYLPTGRPASEAVARTRA